MKRAKFSNTYPEFLTKKLNQNNQQSLFVFKIEINDTINILTNFGKINKKFGKNFGKCE